MSWCTAERSITTPLPDQSSRSVEGPSNMPSQLTVEQLPESEPQVHDPDGESRDVDRLRSSRPSRPSG